MATVVIIHGTMGSPAGNWFPWLATQLRAIGHTVFVPAFPTPEGQSLQNWHKCFRDTVGDIGDDAILIGHSLGAAFALRLLEKQVSPIAHTVLVAGFTGRLNLPEYDQLNASFIDQPFNWTVIRDRCRRFTCISGEGDPYVPQSAGDELARSLGVVNEVVRGGGHLNAEFGLTEFPRILEAL